MLSSRATPRTGLALALTLLYGRQTTMLVEVPSRWLPLLAIAIVMSPFRSASAQDTAPEAQPDGPAEAPKEITIADYAIQASAVEERLERIRTEIRMFDVAADVGKELDSIEARRDEIRADFEALSMRRQMSSELNALRAQLDLLDARVGREIGRLSVYAADLAKMAQQNEEDLELWSEALRSARQSKIAESAVNRTASILLALKKGKKELDKQMRHVLELQTRALDVRNQVRLGEQTAIAAQRDMADAMFQRQNSPLWEREPATATGTEREGYEIDFSWPAVEDALRAKRGIWLFQLFLVLGLGWVLRRVRTRLVERIGKRQQGAPIPWEDQALEAVRHPWAAALLVGLASFRLIYTDRVAEVIVLSWVISIPVWFVVYREMVPPSFRTALLGLAGLGALHIVVALVSGHPSVERGLLLAELLLAAAGSAWFIRFLQKVEVSKRMRQGLWFSLTGVWAHLALIICLFGAAASLLGYSHLAAEAATVAVICTIAASAFMAISRILEALISAAVYHGRLDMFRMVRANRDIVARVLRRIVRIASVAFLAWAVTDMTSAWRPIGGSLGRALETDLGMELAETGVTFADFFVFFLVLWLGWVTARFVSFVLQEELFPRLDMKPGVPFALTTFTRYAIIAIGFIAAVSVLGVPLDRLTIALSALGVGIGFGLQNVVNNLVSGFILLTERPIRLRDKVEIEGVLGNVSNIGIRASTIRTFDGAEVIVPNGDLISQRVTNWTLSARRQRVTIPVGVAYGTDPNEVLGILRAVASENDGVFKDPAPLALFRGFGESSMDFELRIFMDPSDVLDVPSAVTVAINQALKEAGITIPFPQRDLHLHGAPDGFAGAGTGADADAEA
jgi:small-conductance mechanosensitive channel